MEQVGLRNVQVETLKTILTGHKAKYVHTILLSYIMRMVNWKMRFV